jgi:hypothetical protein
MNANVAGGASIRQEDALTRVGMLLIAAISSVHHKVLHGQRRASFGCVGVETTWVWNLSEFVDLGSFMTIRSWGRGAHQT